MNDKDSTAATRGRRLVLGFVAGLSLSAVAVVAAGARTRRGAELPPLDAAAVGASVEGAPWLTAVYGSRADRAVAEGRPADALRDYSRVLAAFPQHPGTRLCRARLLFRSGAVTDPSAREQALQDLAEAEGGYRYQSVMLSAADGDTARTAETWSCLREIRELREAMLNPETGPQGPK